MFKILPLALIWPLAVMSPFILNSLALIWPFINWSPLELTNAAACMVPFTYKSLHWKSADPKEYTLSEIGIKLVPTLPIEAVSTDNVSILAVPSI